MCGQLSVSASLHVTPAKRYVLSLVIVSAEMLAVAASDSGKISASRVPQCNCDIDADVQTQAGLACWRSAQLAAHRQNNVFWLRWLLLEACTGPPQFTAQTSAAHWKERASTGSQALDLTRLLRRCCGQPGCRGTMGASGLMPTSLAMPLPILQPLGCGCRFGRPKVQLAGRQGAGTPTKRQGCWRDPGAARTLPALPPCRR